MKTIFLSIFSMVWVFGTSAQSPRFNKKVNTGKIVKSSVSITPVVKSKVSLVNLKNEKYSKKFIVKSIPKLGISNADLRANVRKSVKITPRKPVNQQLSLQYYGEYSKDLFVLNYRPRAADERHYKYSGFVQFNAVRGKEYRVKISLDLGIRDGAYIDGEQGTPQNGTILVDLGGTEYQVQVSESNKEIDFVFRAETTGIVIGISPLQKRRSEYRSLGLPPGFHPPVPTAPSMAPGYMSDALAIKFIRIDEI